LKIEVQKIEVKVEMQSELATLDWKSHNQRRNACQFLRNAKAVISSQSGGDKAA